MKLTEHFNNLFLRYSNLLIMMNSTFVRRIMSQVVRVLIELRYTETLASMIRVNAKGY